MTPAHRKVHRNILRCAAVLAGAAAVAGSAVACNLILGTSSFSACSSVSDAGWYDADCLACVEANGCDEATACAADPACAARQTCLSRGFPLLSCPLEAGVLASASPDALDAGPLRTRVSALCGATCPAGTWACAGGFSSWPVAPPGTATVTIDPTIFVSLNDRGPAAVIEQVRVCNGFPQDGGVNCPSRFDGGAPGALRFPVTTPFTGYLEVVAQATDGGSPPLDSLIYLSWPVVTDTTIDLRVLTDDGLSVIATALGVGSFDSSKATLVVLAKDCHGDPAANVTLTMAPGQPVDPGKGSDAFTFLNGQPAPTDASVPGSSALPATTTTDGVAGWAEVVPGLVVSITAHARSGQTFTFQPSVQSRSVTYLWLTPVPASPQ